jgi:hypothetical protein
MPVYPAESSGLTTMAEGHLVLIVDPTGLPAAIRYDRIVSLGDVDAMDVYEEYNTFDAASVEKRNGFIKRKLASGDFVAIIDAVPASMDTIADAAVQLAQQFPGDVGTGILWECDHALVQLSPIMVPRGAPTQTKITVRPFGIAGADNFTIDPAADVTVL